MASLDWEAKNSETATNYYSVETQSVVPAMQQIAELKETVERLHVALKEYTSSLESRVANLEKRLG